VLELRGCFVLLSSCILFFSRLICLGVFLHLLPPLALFMFQDLVCFPLVKALFDALILEPKDEVLLVGGVVRDFLLKGEVSKDIDMASNLDTAKVVERLRDLERGKLLTNAISYGSVSLFIDGYSVTITKFRQDLITFGRSALVGEVDDILEDAKRRDFTINAIYVDRMGNMFDFFNGTEDLANRLIKFIGDPEERVVEDYLRILRFFRFSARFTEEYDARFLRVIRRNLDGLRMLSLERVTFEWKEILCSKFSYLALRQMESSGVLKSLFGDVVVDWDRFKNFIFRVISGLVPDGRIVGVMAFFLSVPEEDALFIMNSVLSLSKMEKKKVEFALRHRWLVEIQHIGAHEKEKILGLYRNHNFIVEMMNLNRFLAEDMMALVDGYQKMPLSGKDVLVHMPWLPRDRIDQALRVMHSLWVRSDYKASVDDMIGVASRHFD
jgi:poly(A) polymerase